MGAGVRFVQCKCTFFVLALALALIVDNGASGWAVATYILVL